MAYWKLTLLCLLLCLTLSQGKRRRFLVKSSKRRTPPTPTVQQTTAVPSAVVLDKDSAECGHCNVTECPKVTNPCGGKGETKDQCGCCPTCLTASKAAACKRVDVCKTITCAKSKVCIPNIQGIPMCRCPSILSCPRRSTNALKRLCGVDGKTYKSRCMMKVAECELKKKIRVAHRGPCEAERQERLKERLARKVQRKARREERKFKTKGKKSKKRRRKKKVRALLRTGFKRGKRRRNVRA